MQPPFATSHCLSAGHVMPLAHSMLSLRRHPASATSTIATRTMLQSYHCDLARRPSHMVSCGHASEEGRPEVGCE
jgi:hypothetical protein